MLCLLERGAGDTIGHQGENSVMHILPRNPLQMVWAAGIAGVWESTEDAGEEKPNNFKRQTRKSFFDR